MKPCRRATCVTSGLTGITVNSAKRASMEVDVNSATHWTVFNVWWDQENHSDAAMLSRASCSSASTATAPEVAEPTVWAITNVWWDADNSDDHEMIPTEAWRRSAVAGHAVRDSDDGQQLQSHVADGSRQVFYNVWWDEGCMSVDGEGDDSWPSIAPVSTEGKDGGIGILSPRTVLSSAGSSSCASDASSQRSSCSGVGGVLGSASSADDISGLEQDAYRLSGKKLSLNQKPNDESKKQWLRWAVRQLKWCGEMLEQSVPWESR